VNEYSRVAIFGGVYSNHLALRAAIDDASRRGAQKLLCLGDLGAFGPNPDKVFPLLIDAGVVVMQGNYDNSIANELPDCQCGYTDPADNHYARLSYQYTYDKTSPKWRPWLKALPMEIRFELQSETRNPKSETNPKSEISKFNSEISSFRSETSHVSTRSVLCCHGSPRKTNEFLWESTTPTHLLEKLCDDHRADVLCATHTGLPWMRKLSRNRLFVNCGVLGRPPNDGATRVGYVLLDADDPKIATYVPLEYDHEALAAEMRAERLPEPFVETLMTGWWTTCLEILPAKERARGKW
jgi:hypothetical protein